MEKTIYIFSNGELKRRGNTIGFHSTEGTRYVPVEAVREIAVFGEVSLNKKFLEFLSQQEILLHYFSHHGYYMGTFYPREHYNAGLVTVRQVALYLDSRERLRLARSFVRGGCENIRRVLKYYINRGRKLEAVLNTIESAVTELEGIGSISSLMAVEGRVRQAYYSAWDEILQDKGFSFETRTKRPPQNRINTLISFLNSLLYTTILSEIYKTHLDPRIGYLHENNYRRFSLNLDVAEIFKPIIVDRLIFSLVGKSMIRAQDFREEQGGVYLKQSALRRIVQEYEKKLQITIMARKLRRKVSYRRLIRLELYKIQKHVLEDEPYEPFVANW